MKKFVEWLGIGDNYIAMFSGSKGFHVSIPFEYTGLEPSTKLPFILKQLAKYLKTFFPTLDDSVYNAGRKFRVLNSKHDKTGLYKVPTELSDVETIKANAVEPVELSMGDCINTYIDRAAQPLPALVDAIKQAEAVAEKVDLERTNDTYSKIEAYKDKKCIAAMIEHICTNGVGSEVNNMVLRIVNDFKQKGLTEVGALRVVSGWTKDNTYYDNKEVFNDIVRDVYAGRKKYSFGCLDEYKSKFCSAHCKLWPKLDAAKRPEPKDAAEVLHKLELKAQQTETKLPATQYIAQWLENHGVHMVWSGMVFLKGKSVSAVELKNNIFFDYRSRRYGAPLFYAVSMADIEATLSVYFRKERERLVEDYKRLVAFNEPNDLVEQYLGAVCGTYDPLDAQALRHWIWQVKRKLRGETVSNHLMLVFYGPTKIGKSIAVSRLLSPIMDAVDTDGRLDMCKDERQYFRLAQSLVILFDEMAGGRKAEVEALKNKITSSILVWRNLGSNSKTHAANLSSFIGTSNIEIKHIIRDPTSVRRYYQINVPNKCDWALVNNFDYLALWRSVDETRGDGYITDMKMLEEHQEEQRVQTTVEEFLREEELIPDTTAQGVKVLQTELYRSYKHYWDMQNRPRWVVTKSNFYSEAQQYLLFKRDRTGRCAIAARQLDPPPY